MDAGIRPNAPQPTRWQEHPRTLVFTRDELEVHRMGRCVNAVGFALFLLFLISVFNLGHYMSTPNRGRSPILILSLLFAFRLHQLRSSSSRGDSWQPSVKQLGLR